VHFRRPHTCSPSGQLPAAKSWIPHLARLLRLFSDNAVGRIMHLSLASPADAKIDGPALLLALRRFTHTTTMSISMDVTGVLVAFLLASNVHLSPSIRASPLPASSVPPPLSPPRMPFLALEVLKVRLIPPPDPAAATVTTWWLMLNCALGQRRRAAPLAPLVLLAPPPRSGADYLLPGMLVIEAHRCGIAHAWIILQEVVDEKGMGGDCRVSRVLGASVVPRVHAPVLAVYVHGGVQVLLAAPWEMI
jgi:hypothetical protein